VATARFTIYVAPSRDRPGRPLVLDDIIAFEPGEARFGWRMLAANNREVARSASTFADITSCVEALRDLRRHVADGLPISSRTGRADWSWRLRVGNTDGAASSRTYQRRLQCEAACALFLELVPSAEFVDLEGIGIGAPTPAHRSDR
jgi:uncharacterized protein YegP (UPF0339 family)